MLKGSLHKLSELQRPAGSAVQSHCETYSKPSSYRKSQTRLQGCTDPFKMLCASVAQHGPKSAAETPAKDKAKKLLCNIKATPQATEKGERL